MLQKLAILLLVVSIFGCQKNEPAANTQDEVANANAVKPKRRQRKRLTAEERRQKWIQESYDFFSEPTKVEFDEFTVVIPAGWRQKIHHQGKDHYGLFMSPQQHDVQISMVQPALRQAAGTVMQLKIDNVHRYSENVIQQDIQIGKYQAIQLRSKGKYKTLYVLAILFDKFGFIWTDGVANDDQVEALLQEVKKIMETIEVPNFRPPQDTGPKPISRPNSSIDQKKKD